ncbi:MAG: HEAT repeat domain-containing protein [Candidatus Helarchaeota archaeon]
MANLQSPNLEIVKDTLDQLGDLGDVRAVPHLLKILDTTKDEEIIEAVIWTLARLASSETLVTLLKHPNEKVILETLDALGRRQARETSDAIIPFLHQQNATIRAMATWALGKLVVEKAYGMFVDLLQHDNDSTVRAHAAWALGKFENPDSKRLLSMIKSRETDESVLYNLDEAINAIDNAQCDNSPSSKSSMITVYECPKRQPSCDEQITRTISESDIYLTISIILCDNCTQAKICRVIMTKLDQVRHYTSLKDE